MENRLLTYCQERIKKTWKIAFISAVVIFLLTHLYKITNTLPNHDSFYNVYFDQNMTISGRWFLQYVCGISSYFDLDWVIGVLCAIWIGVVAVAVTELFMIENPFVICLCSALLATCPPTTETMFFGFTADGYFLGFAMAAVSACLTCRRGKWQSYIAGGILLCLCCAIYQAYVSFAAMLCICWLVLELIEGHFDAKAAWNWIMRHVLIYAASMVGYFVAWKLILLVSGISATNYQGIDSVGQFSAAKIISGAVASVSNLFFFFLEWNILEHPVTLYGGLNCLFFLSFLIILIISIIKSGIYRRPHAFILLAIALAVSIPVISMWGFFSASVVYRPMMLHSAVVYYILVILLFDRWTGVKLSTCFGLGMCILVFNFVIMANISYNYLNDCNERTYYDGLQMMEIIEDAQNQYGDAIEQIAFVGSRRLDVDLQTDKPSDHIHMLSVLLEKSLMFDHEHIYSYLSDIFDLDIPRFQDSLLVRLEENHSVQALSQWPHDNCWTVVDNILVINLGDIS